MCDELPSCDIGESGVPLFEGADLEVFTALINCRFNAALTFLYSCC
jgi:hypothetical protein